MDHAALRAAACVGLETAWRCLFRAGFVDLFAMRHCGTGVVSNGAKLTQEMFPYRSFPGWLRSFYSLYLFSFRSQGASSCHVAVAELK